MTSSQHQPIAGQEVRCTCGAEDDLPDDFDFSPSLPPSARPLQGQQSQLSESVLSAHAPETSAPAPILQAEQHLYQEVDAGANPESYNNNANIEEPFVPELQPRYRDTGRDSARAEQSTGAPNSSARAPSSRPRKPTSSRKRQSESKTPFVPGFQTMGRNYNMPDYLIKWQADQERKQKQMTEVPVYLEKRRGRVPMATAVRSRSTQSEIEPRVYRNLGEEIAEPEDEEISPRDVVDEQPRQWKVSCVVMRFEYTCCHSLYRAVCGCLFDSRRLGVLFTL